MQVTAGASWLSTNAGASNTTPLTNLTVAVTSSTLAAGPYTGNILITPTGGSPVNVPVNLTIAAAPAVFRRAHHLDLRLPRRRFRPVAQTTHRFRRWRHPRLQRHAIQQRQLAGGLTRHRYHARDGERFHQPTGLATGVYNGTILVAGAGGATGSTTVTVTLNVTAPLPTITKVTNAASYATGSIAPGEIITLFASDPTHPIGPATAAGLALDSTGKVSTTIGGVQVLINGFACPMIYASASQVSAVVPYEIKMFTSATVLVKFLGQSSNGVLVNVATTVPGVFTANSSGTGPGAILNSNGTTNSRPIRPPGATPWWSTSPVKARPRRPALPGR